MSDYLRGLKYEQLKYMDIETLLRYNRSVLGVDWNYGIDSLFLSTFNPTEYVPWIQIKTILNYRDVIFFGKKIKKTFKLIASGKILTVKSK